MTDKPLIQRAAEIARQKDPNRQYLCILELEPEYADGSNPVPKNTHHFYAIYGCTPQQLVFNRTAPQHYSVMQDDITYVLHVFFIGSIVNFIARGVPTFVSFAALTPERTWNMTSHDVASDIVALARDTFKADAAHLPIHVRWNLLHEANDYIKRAERDFNHGYAARSATEAFKALVRFAQAECMDSKQPLPPFSELVRNNIALQDALNCPRWGLDHIDNSVLAVKSQIPKDIQQIPESVRLHPYDADIADKATSLALSCCGIQWSPEP